VFSNYFPHQAPSPDFSLYYLPQIYIAINPAADKGSACCSAADKKSAIYPAE